MTRFSILSLGLVAALVNLSACNGETLENPIATGEKVERPAEGGEKTSESDQAPAASVPVDNGAAPQTVTGQPPASGTAQTTVTPPATGYAYPDGSLFCDPNDQRLKRTGCRAFDLNADQASEELAWSVQGHETLGVCKIQSGTGTKAGKCVVKDTEGAEYVVKTYHVASISSTAYKPVVVDPHSGAKVDVRCVPEVAGDCSRKPKPAAVAHRHEKKLGDGFSVVFDEDEAHKNDKVAQK